MTDVEEEHDLHKCGVCYDDFDDNDWTNKPYSLFPCGHTFCISCINSLNEPNCPSCKSIIESKAPNWILIQLMTKMTIKPAKLVQLAKCIDEGNKELENSKIKTLENNIAELKEIEKATIDRANNLIEKLNSLKTTLPIRLSQLINLEQEKLDSLKNELETNSENLLVKSVTDLDTYNKEQLLNMKKLLDKKLSALKLCKKIEAIKKENGCEYKLVMLEDKVMESLTGLFIQNMSPTILCNHGDSNEIKSSKVFLLFNEKESGYLDQNYYGYIRNDYHGRESVDLEKEKTNPYLRWIFIEKNGFFQIKNPITQNLLSWDSEHHYINQDEIIDNYGVGEYTKWTVIHFKIENTPYVMLKSFNEKRFFTAQNYKKYSPGAPNNNGFHMTIFDDQDDDKAYFDAYLRWKLIELTNDQLKEPQPELEPEHEPTDLPVDLEDDDNDD